MTECTSWTRIITVADDGTMTEWYPCTEPAPPIDPPEPPDPPVEPETFRFLSEQGAGYWETETGGNWLNE